MNLNIIKPNKALSKAYLKQDINRIQIESFKANLKTLFEKAEKAEKKGEHEEHFKNIVSHFLIDTWYKNSYEINISKRKDLVIHNGKSSSDTIGVIIEAKKPANITEMISVENINVKALWELIFYYFQEREENKNIEIKHLIANNVYDWFIFDENDFDKLFFRNVKFQKLYKTKIESGKDNPFFYSEAQKIISELNEEIHCIHFNFKEFEKIAFNNNNADDEQLIDLYKILSPEHLLKKPFANDSNSLNKNFYNELLHILGLEEKPEGSKKLINRKTKRDEGSLIENTISFITKRKTGAVKDKELSENDIYSIALELCITWLNRILFLKLLEGQLIKYHNGNKEFLFLNTNKIKDFDELEELFFEVLAIKTVNREQSVKEKFGNIPYLNSSLFEDTEYERNYVFLSNLKDRYTLPFFSNSVLKNKAEFKNTESLNTLQYLFEFLSAYNFSSDTSAKIQEDNKTIINASVLGLIFEKINGYKDGSFFTPGFITMYMCRETIRRAVVQKFKELENKEIDTFDDVKSYCSRYFKKDDIQRFNNHINSLKICDPAVGSGHFLVSALNEIIAIKSELNILAGSDGNALDYEITVDNDELIILNKRTNRPFEYVLGDDGKPPKQLQQVQVTLFEEKQKIIENCLFGVDINPKSVLICRLRLWIELLKNAFYIVPNNLSGFKNLTGLELQTLPNIDINIKCGNSLISRYKLKDDVFELFPNFVTKLNEYRFWVSEYKRTSDKALKNQLTRNIKAFTDIFKHRDPRVITLDKQLSKKNEEYLDKFKSTQLFENENTKESEKQRTKLEKEIKQLAEELEELKSNRLFDNAFEWRYEFPEVLNNNGDFIGFDVVIGNPPYGVNLTEREKSYLKNKFTATSGEVEIYTFFIELAMNGLSNSFGYFSFITTNTIYYLDKFSAIRKNAFLNNKIISLVELEKQVFADAPDIVPAIYILQKGQVIENEIKLYKSQETKRVYDLIEFVGFRINQINQSKFENKIDYVFNLSTSEVKENIISRLSLLTSMKKSYKVVYGIKTGDNQKFISQNKIGNFNWKKCASSAKNIKKFAIDWQGDYLNVCDELAGLNKINYEQPKILIQYIRKISMPVRLVCALDELGEYYPLNNFSFIVSEKGNSLISLLGILNSKLMNWYFSNCYVDYNIKPKYIEQLPIPQISKEAQAPFIEKVEKILTIKKENPKADTSALENEIDQLVYELYGLTEEEKAIVEGKN